MLETITTGEKLLRSLDERARVREALERIRAAQEITDNEAVSMNWQNRDNVSHELWSAISLLRPLIV